MKGLLKNIVIGLIYCSGLPFLLREWKQRKSVTILVLHDPDPSHAREIFNTLLRNYHVISLDRYLEFRASKSTVKLPPKSLIITLDDGHIGNYALLPLIRELDIPVTIFLCAGIINTNRHYWFRYSGMQGSSETYKRMGNDERLRQLESMGYSPEKEFDVPQALNARQIAEMSDSVSFQSHTVSHPCLPRCTDGVAEWEIRNSKAVLENDFGLHINALAYPNGDYTDRDVRLSQSAGYACGLTVDAGYNDEKTELFRLRRFSVGDTDGRLLLLVKASGAWAFLQRITGLA